MTLSPKGQLKNARLLTKASNNIYPISGAFSLVSSRSSILLLTSKDSASRVEGTLKPFTRWVAAAAKYKLHFV